MGFGGATCIQKGNLNFQAAAKHLRQEGRQAALLQVVEVALAAEEVHRHRGAALQQRLARRVERRRERALRVFRSCVCRAARSVPVR